jgi:single-stranded-DNA-specific exonuclease
MLYAAMMKKRWRLQKSDENLLKRLQAALHCHPAIASMLVQRGIRSEKEAKRFLNPALKHLQPPFGIKDLNKAVDRIYHAMISSHKLWIFGDYDVDGVTATALLYRFLHDIGFDVSYHIPHRMSEGYGLNSRHISEIAVPNRIDLILTVDCGSSSHDAIALARQAGIDVIVTDHHEPPSTLPPALAIINPKQRDCTAGLQDLAGVGVAFYLMIGIRKMLRDKGFWEKKEEPNLVKACDLVALGTVADMVPLIGNNRILTKIGVDVIRTGGRIGVNSLIEVAGIDKQTIETADLAFKIAPRINAAGRIQHASVAAGLLTTENRDRALKAAVLLDRYNSLRQNEERQTLNDILSLLRKEPDLISPKSIVLSGEGWHEGILGIIASRLSRSHYKPVLIISIDGGVGKGSGRSVPGLNLFEAISACDDLLLQYGGHAMAVGIQLPADSIDPFRKRLENVIVELTGPADFIPEVAIEYELNLQEITPELADEIATLKPFGNQNPEPLFMSRNVHVLSSNIVGGSHRRMLLSQSPESSLASFPAIQFNAGTNSSNMNFFSKIAYKIQWNRWKGNKTLQLVIEDTTL